MRLSCRIQFVPAANILTTSSAEIAKPPVQIAMQFLSLCSRSRKTYFHHVNRTTPLTIISALSKMRKVTRSTSRKNSAVRISENSGPVLLIGITTDTLPRSSA